MKNILLTGISSGIGNTLTKLLIKQDFVVWGVARREKLLKYLSKDLNSKKFIYTVADVSDEKFWNKLILKMKKRQFTPDVVIFNAALNENDLDFGIDMDKLIKIMDVNFFSALKGVKLIPENYSKKIHFIAISSTSALKGNYQEGIGYAASKSALSIAFESLYQRYHHSRLKFTTVFFGPVATDMTRFTKQPPLTLTPTQAAEGIIKAIKNGKPSYYYPKTVFAILGIMRLLPKDLFFSLWTNLQKKYTRK